MFWEILGKNLNNDKSLMISHNGSIHELSQIKYIYNNITATYIYVVIILYKIYFCKLN